MTRRDNSLDQRSVAIARRFGHERDLRALIARRSVELAAARVEVFSRTGADVRGANDSTDPAGRLRVPIDRRAVWLLRLVHMNRCESCPDADWESFWASYTFASFDPSGAPVVAPPMLSVRSPTSAPSGRALRIVAVVTAITAMGAGGYWLRRRRQTASHPTR